MAALVFASVANARAVAATTTRAPALSMVA